MPEPSFCSFPRRWWTIPVQRWIFPAIPAFGPVPLSPSLQPLFQGASLIHPPPLCHFRLPFLKLALGESFLVLTVEQILFNITIESFLPCCWLPSPLLLLPLLHCSRDSFVHVFRLHRQSWPPPSQGSRHSSSETKSSWQSREVYFGNPKWKNIPEDPPLHFFGRSVAWSLCLSFPRGSMHLASLDLSRALVIPPHFQDLSSVLPSCLSCALNPSCDLLNFILSCVQASPWS